MSHLQLPPETLDLLTDLLRHRRPATDVPALPSGSRTARALERAREIWLSAHRAGEEALHGQLTEIRGLASQILADDAVSAHHMRGLMR